MNTLVFVFYFGTIARMATGRGYLELRMVSYSNPKGKEWNNKNCDSMFWVGDCDTKLLFCLDRKIGDNNADNCVIYKKQTGEYQNTNSITFKDNMKGVKNPMIVDMIEWRGDIKFKVKVIDDDSTFYRTELIDTFSRVMTFGASRSKRTARWVEVTWRGDRPYRKTTLRFLRRFYCANNYFGKRCVVYCDAENGPVYYYTCDPASGVKICRPGYEGDNCNEVIDDCKKNKCVNGATCVDKHLRYECKCAKGFTGPHCEIDIDECSTNKCLNNGTCVDGIDSFSCRCEPGYVGPICADHVCLDISPCRNGGVCFFNDTIDVPQCICPAEYKGDNCTQNRCQDIECRNNGICVEGLCICTAGHIGLYCQQDYCEIMPCHHNSVCHIDTCTCSDGFSGKYCETEINFCKSQPCLHDGTCERKIGGFSCRCLPDYEGPTCEQEIPEVEMTTMNLPTKDSVVVPSVAVSARPIHVQECEKVPTWTIVIICIQSVIIVLMMFAFLITKNRRQKKLIITQRGDAINNRPVAFHREVARPSNGGEGISNPQYEETVSTLAGQNTMSDSATMTVGVVCDATPPPYEEIGPRSPETLCERELGDSPMSAQNPLYGVDVTLDEKTDKGHDNLIFYDKNLLVENEGEASGSSPTKENFYSEI